MLDEIIDSEDQEWANLDLLPDTNSENSTPNSRDTILKPNQRLEVVKITRCKMRSKDILEIEIGLKNIVPRKKSFEER